MLRSATVENAKQSSLFFIFASNFRSTRAPTTACNKLPVGQLEAGSSAGIQISRMLFFSFFVAQPRPLLGSSTSNSTHNDHVLQRQHCDFVSSSPIDIC